MDILDSFLTSKDDSEHLILHQNCFDVLSSLPDNSIDLVLTDPPYGINYKLNISKKKRFSEIINDSPDDIDWDKLLSECYRVLKPKKTMYIFGRTDVFMRLAPCIVNSSFRYCHDFLWLKGDMASGNINVFGQTHEIIVCLSKGSPEKSRIVVIDGEEKKRSKASYYGKVSKKEYYGHPTQKPVGLLSYIISNRTDKHDVVFDPFNGSGSTCLAASIMNRRSLGSELSQEYYDISQSRIHDIDHREMYENAIADGYITRNGSVTIKKL